MSGPPDLYLDLDGTILDVAPRYHAVHRSLCAAFGLPEPPELAEFWAEKRCGKSNVALLRDACSDAGIILETGVRVRYEAAWLEAIEEPAWQVLDRPLPGVEAALDALGAAHRLVLVTLRHDGEALRDRLEQLGLDRRFGAVLRGSPRDGEGSTTKERLVRAHGRHASARWFVGDTEIDVRAGQALGLGAVAVTSGIRDEARLAPLAPTWLVPDLAAFAHRLAGGSVEGDADPHGC